MTPGLVLVFAASLCWAGLDVTRKALVGHVRVVPLLVALTLLQVPVFAIWTALEGDSIRDVAYAAPTAASVLLNVAANVLYLRAVQRSPLSLTVPLLSFAPVFTTIVAQPLLGELPNVLQLVGVVAVVLGAFLLNADRREGGGVLSFVRALVRERGSLPMLGTAFCWSLTIIFDKMALGHAAASIHGLVVNAAVGLVMVGVLLVRREVGSLAQLKRAPGLLIVAVLIACAAFGLQLLAISLVFVGVVEAIKRAVSLGASVVLGRVLFAEPITLFKVAAVSLMAGGAVSIVLNA